MGYILLRVFVDLADLIISMVQYIFKVLRFSGYPVFRSQKLIKILIKKNPINLTKVKSIFIVIGMFFNKIKILF